MPRGRCVPMCRSKKRSPLQPPRSAQALGIEIDPRGARRSDPELRRHAAVVWTIPRRRVAADSKLLVEAHLRDCGACFSLFREGPEPAALNWETPEIAAASRRRPLRWGWALAVSAALLVTGVFVYRVYWEVPPGVRAEVQTIDGSAYLIDANGDRRLAAGAELGEGAELRTAGDSHAVLRLADGSVVEVNQRSTLDVGARGRDMTVSLKRGAVIVQAAHRKSGHFTCRTPDCRVAVTGTVFSVDAGLKGSRVAVLRGTVNVAHAGVHTALRAGDQMDDKRQSGAGTAGRAVCLESRPREICGHDGRIGECCASHRADSLPAAALQQRSAGARTGRYGLLCQHSQPGRIPTGGKWSFSGSAQPEPGAAGMVDEGTESQPRTVE